MFRRFKGSGMASPPVAWFVAAEVDRAVKADRESRNTCIDCKVVLIPEPVLCEDCIDVRGNEGMHRFDKRTIHTWRRT